jgi:hypothetical protein
MYARLDERMHEIVCCSTEGLLRTANLDSRLQEGPGARDLRRKDAHVQQRPAGKQMMRGLALGWDT